MLKSTAMKLMLRLRVFVIASMLAVSGYGQIGSSGMRLFTLLLTVSIFNSVTLLSATLADTVTAINHPKLRSLLSQPGGLATAANQVGYLLVTSYNPVIPSLDLAGLKQSADALSLCKVLGKSSRIDSATNIVTTRVHVQIDERLKGAMPRDSYIDIPGGLIAFGRNAVADVRTVESRGIGDGLELLVFLSHTSDPTVFVPTNGMEGIFNVSLSDGLVNSITQYDGHSHLIKYTSMTLAALRNLLFPVVSLNNR